MPDDRRGAGKVADSPVALSEMVLDHAVIDAWKRSPSFVKGLLERLVAVDWMTKADITIDAVRSVWHGRDENQGQSDVVASIASASGARLKVLFENKVNANFMPRQGERYRNRARGMIEEEALLTVRTVLFAPKRYLAATNPEARFFDARVSLEDALDWFTSEERELMHGAAMIRAILERAADGRPLGAKGLFPEVHYPLAAELLQRGSKLHITNHPTDWVFLSDRTPGGKGAKLRYRIREARAEVRLRNVADPDSRHLAAMEPWMSFEQNNTEICFFTRPELTGEARRGAPSPDDIVRIADALEALARWWRAMPKD